MKLHSPVFERTLKRAVSLRLKASSKEVRKRAKESSSVRQHIPGDIIWHLYCIVSLCITIASLKGQGFSTGLQLALVSLIILAQAFFYVPHLYRMLYGSTDLPAFAYLPLPDADIFHWQWQKVVRRSLWPAIYSLAAYLVFALDHQTGWLGVGAACVAAAVQWLVVLSLTTSLAAHRPYWPHQIIGVILMIPFLALLFARKYIPPGLLEHINAHAWIMNLVSPTGWVSQLFGQVATGFNAVMWILLPLLAGVFLLARSARELLASTFTFDEAPDTSYELPADEPPFPTSDVPQEFADIPPPSAILEPWQRTGITDHLDNLHSRAFLQPTQLIATGWIERLFQRWLTPRETLLMEAFLGGFPLWTKTWNKTVFIALGGIAISAWLARSSAEDGQVASLICGLITLFMLLPLGLDFQRFFSGYQIGTSAVAFMAGFPISYRDIRGLLFKSAAVRTLAALPVLVLAGALTVEFVFREQGSRGLVWGMLTGAKFALAMLLIQPVIAASHFSRTMSPRSGHLMARTFNFFLLGLLAVTLIVSLIAGVMVPHLLASLGGLAIAGVSSLLLEAIYIRKYNRNKADLLMQIPST